MLRRLVLLLALAAPACHREPPTTIPSSADLPPLPPSSGTPVGYILDAQRDLKLTDSQIKHLQEIDTSLAARDAEIDTQLRQIETPAEDDKKGHDPEEHVNHAPGVGVHTSAASKKLHQMRNDNDRDALKKAFALLDPTQRAAATKLLESHDVQVPGAAKKSEDLSSDNGKPLPPAP